MEMSTERPTQPLHTIHQPNQPLKGALSLSES